VSGRDRPGGVAILVCGTLVRQVQAIVRERGWQIRVHALPGHLHLYPDRLVEAVEEKLAELEATYERVVVVYGDCGTGGRLDEVINRFAATRSVGLHCYEMLAGEEFARITEAEAGTYFLTPWLVRNWERTALRSMGLDEHPDLIPAYFGNYKQLVFLRQYEDPELDRRAAEIAELLGLRLEIRDTGLAELGRRVAGAVENESPERNASA
jgi:hypothetical protein